MTEKSCGFISRIEENEKFCRFAKKPQNLRKLISAKGNLLKIRAKIKETAIIITLRAFCHKQEGIKQIVINYFYLQHKHEYKQKYASVLNCWLSPFPVIILCENMIQFVLKKAHSNTFKNFLKNDVANTADTRFWSIAFASYIRYGWNPKLQPISINILKMNITNFQIGHMVLFFQLVCYRNCYCNLFVTTG